jgi:hypothetical protein
MPARSVAELLPRPFDKLELDDLRTLIADVGDERETLFFERKQSVSPQSLAKACGAFANTLGGLLVVGVTDEADEFVGIEPVAAEAQLWVKDTLRSHVLPLPPFRARWLSLSEGDAGPGVLLVLVEESATTPHLLVRRGAVYVRNPGSSDPVPIADQRQLLSLIERGEDARARAERRADDVIAAVARPGLRPRYRLSLAPSGWADKFAIGKAVPELIASKTWGAMGYERREVEWEQHSVNVTRYYETRTWERFHETARLSAQGALAFEHGGGRDPDTPTEQAGLATWFAEHLAKGRDVLLDLGGHGDLRVVYGVDLSNGLLAESEYKATSAGFAFARRWTSLDADDERDSALRDAFIDDFRRAVGFAPIR